MTESRELLEDLQAAAPEVRIGLSRAGVRGVSKAIRLRWGDAEKLIAADIDCAVDLGSAQKGVHMSRFGELFEETIEEVVIGEAFLVEELAEHIARHIVDRQRAGRAEVKITARYPLERRTPVTRLATQEMVALVGIAAASDGASRRLVGVEATGINACPCAQGLVRGRATERLLEAGFDDVDVERISLKSALDRYLSLADDDFVLGRQLNFETIHSHEVLAERFGTVGELRRELATGDPAVRHTELHEWLATPSK